MLRESTHRFVNPAPTEGSRPATCRTRFLGAAAGVSGLLLLAGSVLPSVSGADYIQLTGVPDYDWHMGCFGTATGNLAAYWDRHGLPGLYTGPTNGGLAPLSTFGGNGGIRALWASEAGVDGRPFNRPGHVDDYWVDYEYTGNDPWRNSGRAEHSPDCLGDFIGLNQNQWADLGGECSGNIDGYSFNYFDQAGRRRANYTPTDASGSLVPDIQSGLRRWTAWREYEADTFSQLTDFNPDLQPGGGPGFTFADLKAEIDAGYPVLLFMQAFGVFSRTLDGKPRQNPIIHGMLAYGYVIDDDGTEYVRYRTSWASGDSQFSPWNSANWTPNGDLNLPLRGVIGYHPKPKIVSVSEWQGRVNLRWEGPMSRVRDSVADLERPVHAYVVEQTSRLGTGDWQPVTEPLTQLDTTLPVCCPEGAFYRVRLVAAP